MDSAAMTVWRPRLWVRIVAIAAPVILAVPLVLPKAANPGWARGTPSDQVGWGLGLLAVALMLAWWAWAARIEVDADEVRVTNFLKAHRMARVDVAGVRPGPFGIEFRDHRGRKIVGIAVQATAVWFGERPRWADVAEVVTSVAPDWEMD